MVDSTKQLRNVAFGGNWSEELIQNGTTHEVLKVFRHAANSCDEFDPRGAELTGALDYVEQHLDKGKAFRAGIEKALSLPRPSERKSEMLRYVSLIEEWV